MSSPNEIEEVNDLTKEISDICQGSHDPDIAVMGALNAAIRLTRIYSGKSNVQACESLIQCLEDILVMERAVEENTKNGAH